MALSMRKVVADFLNINQRRVLSHHLRLSTFSSPGKMNGTRYLSHAKTDSNRQKYFTGNVPLLSASVAGFVSWLLDIDSADSTSNEDKLILTMKRAVLSQQRGNFGESEKHFHDALELLVQRRQSQEIDDSEATRIQAILYGYLSNLALEAGQLKKAEVLYKDTLRLILTIGKKQNDNGVVEISLKLATIYASLDRHAEAQAGYKFCIETQERKLKECNNEDDDSNTEALYGMCLNAYAKYCYIQRHLLDARSNYEKSLAVAEKVFGAEHEQILVVTSDLAVVCCELNDFNAAKGYLERVVHVATSIGSESLPTYLCNLGALLLQMEQLGESKRICDRAVSLARTNGDDEAMKKAQFCLAEIKKRKSGR